MAGLAWGFEGSRPCLLSEILQFWCILDFSVDLFTAYGGTVSVPTTILDLWSSQVAILMMCVLNVELGKEHDQYPL